MKARGHICSQVLCRSMRKHFDFPCRETMTVNPSGVYVRMGQGPSYGADKRGAPIIVPLGLPVLFGLW